MSAETEQYEAVFVDLVKKSWKMHGEMDHATRVDDIFLGAVIASAVRLGRCLIDLESDGTSHFVRFEDMGNRARMTFRPLIWKLEEYLGAGGLVPDYEKIASHIYCCEVSLYKYLDGRLQLG